MASEEKAESAGLSAPSSGGGGRLTVILTTVNLVATLGLGAIVALSHLKEKNRPAVEDIAAHPEAETAAAEGAKEGGHGGAEGAKDDKDEKGHGAGKGAKKGHEYGKMVTLEQFTVNLATPGSVSPKFVRVNVSLEVQNDDVESEVSSKMPQVRNAIIDLFNSKRPTDLATSEGREYLKEEIRNAINGFMVTGKVKGVYFTNFAVSS